MIRDAQLGLLDTIPPTLISEKAPVASHIWEASRVFVSQAVPAGLRLRVQMLLIGEMVTSARQLGASSLLGLIPEHSPRLARRSGIDCQPAGPVMEIGGEASVCVRINLAQKMH
jgi:N-acyl-L-homoserine lactone synthetase